MKLYEITELQRVLEEENDEEIKHDLKDLIGKELQEKAQNVIMLIKNKEANIEAIDNEIKRLQQLKKRHIAQLENVKEYTIYNLNKMEQNSVTTRILFCNTSLLSKISGTFSVKPRKNLAYSTKSA